MDERRASSSAFPEQPGEASSSTSRGPSSRFRPAGRGRGAWRARQNNSNTWSSGSSDILPGSQGRNIPYAASPISRASFHRGASRFRGGRRGLEGASPRHAASRNGDAWSSSSSDVLPGSQGRASSNDRQRPGLASSNDRQRPSSLGTASIDQASSSGSSSSWPPRSRASSNGRQRPSSLGTASNYQASSLGSSTSWPPQMFTREYIRKHISLDQYQALMMSFDPKKMRVCEDVYDLPPDWDSDLIVDSMAMLTRRFVNKLAVMGITGRTLISTENGCRDEKSNNFVKNLYDRLYLKKDFSEEDGRQVLQFYLDERGDALELLFKEAMKRKDFRDALHASELPFPGTWDVELIRRFSLLRDHFAGKPSLPAQDFLRMIAFLQLDQIQKLANALQENVDELILIQGRSTPCPDIFNPWVCAFRSHYGIREPLVPLDGEFMEHGEVVTFVWMHKNGALGRGQVFVRSAFTACQTCSLQRDSVEGSSGIQFRPRGRLGLCYGRSTPVQEIWDGDDYPGGKEALLELLFSVAQLQGYNIPEK